MIAYGYTGGPRMLTDLLVLLLTLAAVFCLGWLCRGIRENRGAPQPRPGQGSCDSRGSKAGPAARKRHRVPNRTTPLANSEGDG